MSGAEMQSQIFQQHRIVMDNMEPSVALTESCRAKAITCY
jgi:hypothetical protein